MSRALPSLLLVEDDPVSLELLCSYLEEGGYQLTTACDGDAAWRLLTNPASDFDLVISDRAMPRMDGMELLERIKREPRFVDLPVIFETALTQPADIADGIAAGVYYYLTKPYNRNLLLAVVKAALSARGERRRIAESIRRASGGMRLLQRGSFRLRGPHEAYELAVLIGAATPRPDSVAMGIGELLLNAIEHGNLELSYRDKGTLLIDERFDEEVAHRLNTSPWRERWVKVDVERAAGSLVVRIADQGKGFDPTPYLSLDPARALDPNGRGIAMARQIAFSKLEYLGCGNTALVRIDD